MQFIPQAGTGVGVGVGAEQTPLVHVVHPSFAARQSAGIWQGTPHAGTEVGVGVAAGGQAPQSWGHEVQSSPSSQTPLPQTGGVGVGVQLTLQ